jgi:hypothetical protein
VVAVHRIVSSHYFVVVLRCQRLEDPASNGNASLRNGAWYFGDDHFAFGSWGTGKGQPGIAAAHVTAITEVIRRMIG